MTETIATNANVDRLRQQMEGNGFEIATWGQGVSVRCLVCSRATLYGARDAARMDIRTVIRDHTCPK